MASLSLKCWRWSLKAKLTTSRTLKVIDNPKSDVKFNAVTSSNTCYVTMCLNVILIKRFIKDESISDAATWRDRPESGRMIDPFLRVFWIPITSIEPHDGLHLKLVDNIFRRQHRSATVLWWIFVVPCIFTRMDSELVSNSLKLWIVIRCGIVDPKTGLGIKQSNIKLCTKLSSVSNIFRKFFNWWPREKK